MILSRPIVRKSAAHHRPQSGIDPLAESESLVKCLSARIVAADMEKRDHSALERGVGNFAGEAGGVPASL